MKYVNNDACYPSICVVGQIMKALLSGKYDLNKVAIAMTQTGGGCRATNYVGFIRRALQNAGYAPDSGHCAECAQGIEKQPWISSIPCPCLKAAMEAIVYGDVFMRVLYRMRPYEIGQRQRQHASMRNGPNRFASPPSQARAKQQFQERIFRALFGTLTHLPD